jgi:hypothetical protein
MYIYLYKWFQNEWPLWKSASKYERKSDGVLNLWNKIKQNSKNKFAVKFNLFTEMQLYETRVAITQRSCF